MGSIKIRDSVNKHLRQIRRRAYLKLVLYGSIAAIMAANIAPHLYHSTMLPFIVSVTTVVLGAFLLIGVLGSIPILHFKEVSISEINKNKKDILEKPFEVFEEAEYWKDEGFEVKKNKESYLKLVGKPSIIHRVLDKEIEIELKVIQKSENILSIDSLENGKLMTRSRVRLEEREGKTRILTETISSKRYSLDYVTFFEIVLPAIIKSEDLNELDEEIIEEDFWVSLIQPEFELDVEVEDPTPENFD